MTTNMCWMPRITTSLSTVPLEIYAKLDGSRNTEFVSVFHICSFVIYLDFFRLLWDLPEVDLCLNSQSDEHDSDDILPWVWQIGRNQKRQNNPSKSLLLPFLKWTRITEDLSQIASVWLPLTLGGCRHHHCSPHHHGMRINPLIIFFAEVWVGGVLKKWPFN